MKKVLVEYGCSRCFAAPAAAADLAARPYTKAPPALIAVVYDWSGFYIGANGGWGQSHNCVDFFNAGRDRFHRAVAVIVPEASSAGRSGIAGKPISSCSDWKHKAIGPTSAAGASACSTRRSQPNVKTDAIGLFTGQIGWAWNAALLYVKGGAAVTDNHLTYSITLPASVWSRQVRRAGAAPWVSALNMASRRTGRSALNTTICGWEMRTTPSPWSTRASQAYSTTGSVRTSIWSPCALTTASAAGEPLLSRRDTDLFLDI